MSCGLKYFLTAKLTEMQTITKSDFSAAFMKVGCEGRAEGGRGNTGRTGSDGPQLLLLNTSAAWLSLSCLYNSASLCLAAFSSYHHKRG